jgi:hypothetical protein
MDGIDLEDNKDTALRVMWIMDMKKLKNKIIFILVVFVITLTACGPVSYKHSYTIRTSYREWVKQIGLFSHEHIKIQSYEEENNSVTVFIEYSDGLSGYKEMCEIVNAHNEFVDKNPDYFPENISISFVNRYASEYTASFFYNNSSINCGTDSYEGELGREHTAKMQFMNIEMDPGNTEIEYSDEVEINVPVVILRNFYINLPSESDYAFLKECKNAEQIIIDFQNVEYDANEVSKSIKKYLPDVEVYDVVTADKQEHLEKIQ